MILPHSTTKYLTLPLTCSRAASPSPHSRETPFSGCRRRSPPMLRCPASGRGSLGGGRGGSTRNSTPAHCRATLLLILWSRCLLETTREEKTHQTTRISSTEQE